VTWQSRFETFPFGAAARALARVAAAIGMAAGVAACDSVDFGVGPAPGETAAGAPPPTRPDTYDTSALFSGQVDEGGAVLGVNSFLWRASLDTLSFLPLSSADPFGGVIITDWYAPPESPNERFKVTAYILDRSLRADGVRVSVFRQVQESPGNWIDAPVDQSMGVDLENTILTRARQLKIRTSPG